MAKDNDVAKGFAMFSVYLPICHFPFCFCNARTKILWREAKPICSCLLMYLLLLLLQDFRKRLIFSGSGFAKVSACELFAFVTIYSLFVVISNVKRLLSTYFTTILGAANKNKKTMGGI